MISLSFRGRAKARSRYAPPPPADNLDVPDDMAIISTPNHFRCPISLDLMKDPVTLPTGITYDRDSIEKWLEEGNPTCPLTNQLLHPPFDLIPNHSLRKMIQSWCVQNPSYGIQRIPTPRVPVTPFQLSQACNRIRGAIGDRDPRRCQELVGKIKNWGKESERNRRCIVQNGVDCDLSACFQSFASASPSPSSISLLGEILSVLVWMFPLGVESQRMLADPISLNCLVWFLKSNGDLSARKHAIFVLKELLSWDQRLLSALAAIEGVNQALVDAIKDPVCPAAAKAALVVISHITAPSNNPRSEKMISTFGEMGLVSLIAEMIVDGDKAICEKGLSVLNNICGSKEGRQGVYENALIVAGLIKTMVRTSELASDLSVSILWKLICEDEERDDVVVEALQMGAFQKLLVLLQLGCPEPTKEKVKKLLKSFNCYRNGVACLDSLHYKYLKNPF